MAQNFNRYTPEAAAEVAIGLVDNGLILGADATHYTDGLFAAPGGGRISLRVPGALTARSRALRDKTTAITLDEIVENVVPVDLTGQRYSAVRVSDAELSLDITDFAKQVLLPQSDAIIEGLEHDLAEVLDGIDPEAGITYSNTDPAAVFIQGRRALRARGVDVANSDLVAYVGGNVADDLLGSGALAFDKTGDANALRNGSLGRVHGFRAIETARIGDDEVVFTVKGGLYIATRAPQVPLGAGFGATINKDGIALTYVRDYDASVLSDRSIVSVFSGVGVSPLYDVTRNHATGATSVAEVEGGAVIKVDAAA